jgi:type IV pilus assembly protein PilF
MTTLPQRRAHRRASWLAASLGIALLAAPAWARSRSSIEADAQRYYRLGQTEFEQGKTQQAIESLKKAIGIDPKMAEAYNYLGVVYLAQSDPEQAAKYLRKAVDLNPFYTDAHNSLGVAYRKEKKFDRALGEFNAALKDKTYATPEKIHLNLGYLYLDQGKGTEAAASFQEALRTRPDYLLGMLGLGVAYQRLGQRDLAEQQFRKVVQLGPDSSEAAQARQLLGGKAKQEGS